MTCKLLTSLALLQIALNCFSQSDFRPGFIIKNNGDTLYGKIDYRGDKIMSQSCKFKTLKDSLIIYRPEDIKGYRFTGDKYFISKEIGGTPVFLEFLVAGKVNLYYARTDSGDHYYIERDSIPVTELTNKKLIKTIDGKQYFYESKDYVRTLNLFMHDADGILPKIEALHEPDHRELIGIAELYHNTVCKDKSCTIYEKQLRVTRVLIEPVLGVTWYNKLNRAFPEYGCEIYLWAPRTSEKLYIKTGILRSSISDPEPFYSSGEGGKTQITRFPLQIQYSTNSQKINPRFEFGFDYVRYKTNDDKESNFDGCLGLGLSIPLSDKVHLALDLNSEVSGFLIPSAYHYTFLMGYVGFVIQL